MEQYLLVYVVGCVRFPFGRGWHRDQRSRRERENATCENASHAARPSAAMGNMSSRTITVVVVTTAGLSTVGFFWASKLMVQNTFSFITGLDITNPWDAGVGALCAFVFAVTLYYINYPEGQLAAEGIADRGKGATHAYQRKDS